MHMDGMAVVEHHHADGVMHHHTTEASDVGKASTPDKEPHKNSGGRCCGLITPSAMPASEVTLIKPLTVASTCAIEPAPSVDDNAPPRLDRPPIIT